jgi:RNA polymerase sigma-70 factor (ECF subfamily)
MGLRECDVRPSSGEKANVSIMPDTKASIPRPDVADNEEDLALLSRIGEGDSGALRTLYVKYHDRLLGFIFSITRQLDSAREGVNDVMLVVWRKARQFQGRSKVRTWILGIAYRKGLKLADTSRRWTERFPSLETLQVNEPFDPTSEPTRSLEALERLEGALARLPPKQRAIVELTYVYGHSYKEIAEIVDCPVNTVKTRMFHARQTLRRLAVADGD